MLPTPFKRNVLHMGIPRERQEQTFTLSQHSTRKACFLSALASSPEAVTSMSARYSSLPLFYLE